VSVGVLTDNYPFSFVDGSGRPVGYVVDLLAAIERTMGLTLRRVVGPTQQINGAFPRGEWTCSSRTPSSPNARFRPISPCRT
jgi:ABC-type amino acid transport substrate-binding protein